MNLIIEAPLNSLSFGNVSYNFLRELFKANAEIAYIPIGEPDLSAFNPKPEFLDWLNKAANRRFECLDLDIPTLRLWHLNGSDFLRSRQQYLLTFYECNDPTLVEKKIANMQSKTFFSSEFSQKQFENSEKFALGFDEDFHQTGKKYMEGVVHFGLSGKFEKRKHTEKIIRTWLKKYGNNSKYLLSCCVTNPFVKPDQMNQIIANVLEGKHYSNINFIPWLRTNAEVNEFTNAIDIDLTGMSGGEGWNLPAFNATCLGKWSVVLNGTSHKEWANKNNSILVEPNGEQESEDGMFFKKGSPFNQGTFLTFDEEEFISAMEKSETLVGQFNMSGSILGQTFTYKKALEDIFSRINSAQ
jgi:hypothetical protein